jgi:hypothetical protein
LNQGTAVAFRVVVFVLVFPIVIAIVAYLLWH